MQQFVLHHIAGQHRCAGHVACMSWLSLQIAADLGYHCFVNLQGGSENAWLQSSKETI